MIAKDQELRTTQSEQRRAELGDLPFQTGKAFGVNYGVASNGVPRYNTNPSVITARDKLRATMRLQLFNSLARASKPSLYD